MDVQQQLCRDYDSHSQFCSASQNVPQIVVTDYDQEAGTTPDLGPQTEGQPIPVWIGPRWDSDSYDTLDSDLMTHKSLDDIAASDVAENEIQVEFPASDTAANEFREDFAGLSSATSKSPADFAAPNESSVKSAASNAAKTESRTDVTPSKTDATEAYFEAFETETRTVLADYGYSDMSDHGACLCAFEPQHPSVECADVDLLVEHSKAFPHSQEIDVVNRCPTRTRVPAAFATEESDELLAGRTAVMVQRLSEEMEGVFHGHKPPQRAATCRSQTVEPNVPRWSSGHSSTCQFKAKESRGSTVTLTNPTECEITYRSYMVEATIGDLCDILRNVDDLRLSSLIPAEEPAEAPSDTKMKKVDRTLC